MHFLRKEAQIAMADDRLLRARERIKGAAAKTCGAIGSATVRGYKKRRRRLLAGSKWSGGRLCRQVFKKEGESMEGAEERLLHENKER